MKPLRERNQATVGAVAVVLIVCAVLVAFFANDLPVIGGGSSYGAYFGDSAGLAAGNEVRVAGVKVGEVSAVSLAGEQVRVDFQVKNTWIGDQTRASIQIKTLLGDKYLELDPAGNGDQDRDVPIPQNRTRTPLDVTQALGQLSTTVDAINTDQLAGAFQTISNTLKNTPESMKNALAGLSALSKTISSRDAALSTLLNNTKQVSQTVASRDAQLQKLLSDGNLLLSELQYRRDAITALLTGTQNLATQLQGLVSDNQAQLNPTLTSLDQVTTVLQQNQDNLNKLIGSLAPYIRVFTNVVSSGRWFDGYICGLLPPNVNGSLVSVNPDACTPPNAGSGMPAANGGGH